MGSGDEHEGLWDASTQPAALAPSQPLHCGKPPAPALTLLSLGDLLGRKKAQEEKNPSYHVQQLRLPGRQDPDSFQMAQ